GSSLPNFQPISEMYGFEFASMVEMPVEKGIALLSGMDVVEMPRPSGNIAFDYERRAELANELIGSYGGVYIHIKGPDEPAHDGDCGSKKQSIELIDSFFFKNLKIDMSSTLIVVTADHSTPCSMKAHSDDPVPLLVAGCSIKSDGTKTFGESNCRKGSLGQLNGKELLKKIISL
ncbi:MAG: hypothetical protein LUP94_02000, partial [Candidatus Methanomethylicus sp.]|nr:hypothetical protein [Candidatus Methanomethylicus sp.]